MARPILVPNNIIISARITKEMDELLNDIASLETHNTDNLVTKQQLIRDALTFVYTDNERMRECFRRSRQGSAKKKKFQ